MSGFELENAGAGPSPFRLGDVLTDTDVDAVVLLLQRDYYCPQCRQQVQDVAAHYDEFEAEKALVVSVLPDSIEKARKWQDSYDLPFPLLADPATEVGDELEQPSRFGVLGTLHDMIGRMPEALVLDVRGESPTATSVHRGTAPSDRPSIDELLEAVSTLS